MFRCGYKDGGTHYTIALVMSFVYCCGYRFGGILCTVASLTSVASSVAIAQLLAHNIAHHI